MSFAGVVPVAPAAPRGARPAASPFAATPRTPRFFTPRGGEVRPVGAYRGRTWTIADAGKIFPNIGAKDEFLDAWPSETTRLLCRERHWSARYMEGATGTCIFETVHR